MSDQHDMTTRPAEPGELCTCGRQAIAVYPSDTYGEVGDCGIRDGGDRTGPCPFCGGPRHGEQGELGDRCPSYRLRLDEPGRIPLPAADEEIPTDREAERQREEHLEDLDEPE
jgi:hypothetical protein